MRRIGAARAGREPLFDASATRAIEREALAALPPHTLMARAGEALARLAQALAPHARHIWIACGPGNNGGDGLIAAAHLQQRLALGGQRLHVTLLADPDALPADAAWALAQARAAGVHLSPAPPSEADLVIDALLGIGAQRPPQGLLAAHLDALDRLNAAGALRLSVDLPSGLLADTGENLHAGAEPAETSRAGERHTLSLLTLKPGLFTAAGRDTAGCVWFDALGVDPTSMQPPPAPRAWLNTGEPGAPAARPHASHKGSWGDVVVIGGQGVSVQGTGMTGAAVLAARAALHGGAGRVYLALLDEPHAVPTLAWDPLCPELMLRTPAALRAGGLLGSAAVVCGCGGGTAVAPCLPTVLRDACTLVLDADALNAIAADPSLQAMLQARGPLPGHTTVLTPHPLEAARLLQTDTPTVMRDRLAAAQALSDRFAAICVLKGSGSVIAQPGAAPWINHSGNAALATAGTGDVLAGLIGCALASPTAAGAAFERVARAVHTHGARADAAVAGGRQLLTASELARATAGRDH